MQNYVFFANPTNRATDMMAKIAIIAMVAKVAKLAIIAIIGAVAARDGRSP